MSMTLKRWYQLCLFLPILLPLLFGGLCWLVTGHFMGQMVAPKPEPVMPFLTIPILILSGITMFLVMGLFFGGIPYLAFLGILLWLYKDRDAVFWGRISYILPIFFIPFCAAGFVLIYEQAAAMTLAFMAIPYGYFYVFLAHILTWLALKTGKVTDTLS